MNEVSHQSVALLLDALEQRGIDEHPLWRGLSIDRESLRRRGERISWETWVAMMGRVQEASESLGLPLEDLFARGGGVRTRHPFVQIASGVLSLKDAYSFFTRWGVRRAFVVIRGRMEMTDARTGRITIDIDPRRLGSEPTLRFMVGVMRNISHLQGLPRASIRIETLTPHHAEYRVELPEERRLLSRARRVISSLGGVAATLDELEQQANDLARSTTALRERDAWLDVALEAGRIGLWRWDPATRRVAVSATMASWLGLPGQTEIDTKTWGVLLHPDDRDRMSDVMATALRDRTPFVAEYRIVRPTGDVQWLRVAGRVHAGADGQVSAYGSSVDITDQKTMERRLRHADRLIATGTLAAGVAHEINNPLTYVMGSVDLIHRRLKAHPAALAATSELITQTLDGLDRIRAVVADVKAFARQDEDESVGAVDLSAVVAAATRIVAANVRHRATLTTELATDAPVVLANDARLGQVLINLIVNASQAMPERDPVDNLIVVRTRRLASGEGAIDVDDNGSGIAPEILPRVFDPFFTTKPVGVGTGLGLSVCQGIVSSFGGRIDVESQIGRGTRFTVVLPAASSDTVATQPKEPSVAEVAPRRVLVIDDEPLIRHVVVRSLIAHGYQVDEAPNGREGLAMAVEGTYDAILCDLMMPDLDGVALHDELSRRRPELVSRIVFISGGAVTPRTQSFIARSDVTIVGKPFALEQLISAIERVGQAELARPSA